MLAKSIHKRSPADYSKIGRLGLSQILKELLHQRRLRDAEEVSAAEGR